MPLKEIKKEPERKKLEVKAANLFADYSKNIQKHAEIMRDNADKMKPVLGKGGEDRLKEMELELLNEIYLHHKRLDKIDKARSNRLVSSDPNDPTVIKVALNQTKQVMDALIKAHAEASDLASKKGANLSLNTKSLPFLDAKRTRLVGKLKKALDGIDETYKTEKKLP